MSQCYLDVITNKYHFVPVRFYTNITDFSAPFTIYKTNFSQTPILQFQTEITDMLVFGKITEVSAGFSGKAMNRRSGSVKLVKIGAARLAAWKWVWG